MRCRPVDASPRRRRLQANTRTVIAFGLALTAAIGLAPASTAATSTSCLPRPMAVTAQDADRLFALADRKLAAAATAAPAGRKPFGALRGEAEYRRTSARQWTSGFFAAELWRMYQRTRDPQWLAAARDYTQDLLRVARYTGSHDLNFMVGLPTGIGAQLDPDGARRTAYAQARQTAARTLDRRWNGNVKALKSSDYEGQWGVIVDSAMNAPLLIEIGLAQGGPDGRRLADHGVEHMRTLARTFVRADGSTFHRMAFDPQTGDLLGPLPGQGLDPWRSTWARGQAWAINGFTQAWMLTGDPVLKDAAIRTADFWRSRVPAGCITAWDFDIDNPRSPRDSGATAIAVSGLLRLGRALGPDGAEITDYANTTLSLLTSPWLTTTYSVNPGLLLQQTVNVNSDPREGSYVWGDYYLLESLSPEIREAR